MTTVVQNLAPDGRNLNPQGAPSPILPAITVGVKTRLELRFQAPDGSPADPFDRAGGCSAFRFVLAEDWNPETPVLFSTEAVERVSEGVYRLALDNTRTAGVLAALADRPFRELGAELSGMAAEETWENPSACVPFALLVRNRRDTGELPPPDPARNYLTAEALADALAALPEARGRSLTAVSDKVEAIAAALRSLAAPARS